MIKVIAEKNDSNDIGKYVVVNTEPRLANKVMLVPVSVETVLNRTREFTGWAYGERLHIYNMSSIQYKATSMEDAENWINQHKGITVRELINTNKG